MKIIISFILCTLGIIGLLGSSIPVFEFGEYRISILIASIMLFVVGIIVLANDKDF